jgi:lysophosphatidate acyltransferase
MSILSYFLTGVFYYTVLTLSLFALSIPVPRAGFFARCLSSYAALLICATYGVLASIFLRLVGYGRVSQWATARSFKWVMFLVTGTYFDIVEGAENLSTRPAVFIGNHQTELDVLLLGAIFPPYCSVTAKKSLKKVPLLGWFMALSRTVFIDRANRETALKAFDGAAKEMKTQRQSVFIFPEGTRSYSSEPKLLLFKKGAFHLAVKAGVEIVPIVAENYAHVLSIKKMTFRAGGIRVKGELGPLDLIVSFLLLILYLVLPPISTKNLTSADVDKLTQDTRESMLQVLTDLSKSKEGYNK